MYAGRWGFARRLAPITQQAGDRCRLGAKQPLGYEVIVACGLLHCSMKKAASMGGFFVWLTGAFGQVSDMKNPPEQDVVI